jgi:Tol biopolymer transport system component
VLLPLAGGSSRELYRTDLGVGRVRWLPDGSALLAVMSSGLERRVFGRASGGAIWRIDYASGQAEQLTSGLANNDPYSLDIAADGAVADVINTFVSDLWIAPADRLDSLRPLTSDHPVIGRHTWLPDNDTMVYRDMSGRLNAVHKDGRAFSLPVPDGEFTTGVSVCGDGSYVVFSTRSNLWRVTPNAGAPIKLTSGFRDFNAACSADGKSVWYLSREPNTPHPSLWRVSIDGGRPEPMNLAGYDVLPSPTGRMMLYQTDWVEEGANRNRRDRWEIISSSDRKRLYTFDVAGDTDIGMMTKWAPDESGVDYVVTKDGVSNIWRQLLTGGPPVQVTQFSVQRIFSFAWSPDGRWLSLGMGVFRSDVVLMSSQQ